jgi:hypothetical protein
MAEFKKGPAIARSGNIRDAVFAYVSVCCTVLADKPVLRKTKEAEGTLGKWRCSSCRKRCKVTVQSKVKWMPVQKVEPVQGEKAL